ncbi:MAG: hypothetical protein PHP03_01595 [Candidatus Pacebacteria bacterium]|nr:hypothetical protein [Candidatus Paceibacterota bacterium]
MKKYLLSLLILGFSVVCSAVIINGAIAQTQTTLQPQEQKMPGDISYPIQELGNCQDKEACKTYCDSSKNTGACLAFAEKYNLLSEEELISAKKFKDAGMVGPGGCKGKDACDEYCGNTDHIDACIAFAEKNNLIPANELDNAKKVQAAIKKGVKPPACKTKKECDAYCEESAHMEECINFGIESGFMQGKELENAQKMLAALKKGVTPPPCKGKEACDEYCSNPDNMETCMNFAIESGMMDENQKEQSQKMLQAIKKGVKPPACKGQEACDAYCQSEEHMEECINFSVAAGMMNEKEAEMAKKTKGKGPGGCKSKDECEAFCNNPDNQETCFQFGKDNGMIPEEELQRMEKGKADFKENFTNTMNQAPQDVKTCIIEAAGGEAVAEKFQSGTVMPTRDFGDKMKTCFDQYMPKGQGGPGEGGNMAPGDNNGQFQPGPGTTNPGGQMMPPQSGPGGCKTPEECKSYCETNPDQCKNTQQCEGDDCQQMMPGTSGGMMPKCEGENCAQQPPMQGTQGTQGMEGQYIQQQPGQFNPLQKIQDMQQGIMKPGTEEFNEINPAMPGQQIMGGQQMNQTSPGMSPTNQQMMPGTQQPNQSGPAPVQQETIMGPGGGGTMQPGSTQPMQQYVEPQQVGPGPGSETTPPATPPEPTPTGEPSGSVNQHSLIGTVLQFFKSLFSK